MEARKLHPPETFPLFIKIYKRKLPALLLFEIERGTEYEEEWKILGTKPRGKDFIAVWKLAKLQGLVWKTTGVRLEVCS